MIVKIIILRLLGSSDDKEREDRRSKTRLADGGRGGAAPRGSQGSALKALRIRSTGRSDAMGIGASGGSRKNRRHDVWCRMESKPSQPLGTG